MHRPCVRCRFSVCTPNYRFVDDGMCGCPLRVLVSGEPDRCETDFQDRALPVEECLYHQVNGGKKKA